MGSTAPQVEAGAVDALYRRQGYPVGFMDANEWVDRKRLMPCSVR